jgi:hypothetical protein
VVEDVAELGVTLARCDANTVTDAVGPEIYSFEELVLLIAANVASTIRMRTAGANHGSSFCRWGAPNRASYVVVCAKQKNACNALAQHAGGKLNAMIERGMIEHGEARAYRASFWDHRSRTRGAQSALE